MSLMHLLKKGKEARLLAVEVGVGAGPPRPQSRKLMNGRSFGEGHHHERMGPLPEPEASRFQPLESPQRHP